MQRTITVTLLILGIYTSSLSAQQWTYGLKAGATLSQVTELPHKEAFAFENLITYQHAPVLQFHAGFWVQYQLDKRQTLQGELLWTQQAYQSDDWFAQREGLGQLQFNYLSVPILLRYHITSRLSAALGPQLSLLLADRLRKSEGDDLWLDLNEDEIAWELGANLEIAYQINRWRLGLRAQRDLTPFYTIPLFNLNGTYLTRGKYYHQALYLWVGYALGG